MVQVKVVFEASSSDDPYTRSFYAGYDEVPQLTDRFKLGSSYQYFYYVDYVNLSEGTHTIYFANDGEAPYSWVGSIKVDDKEVVRGYLGRDRPPLAASVTIGTETTTQTIQASNPATGETVTTTQTVATPTVSAAPAPPKPAKPWYVEVLPYVLMLGAVAGLVYVSTRRR
jgi:hypothetical protein